MSHTKSASIMDASILWPAIGGAFRKLNPRTLIKNPVMFVVAVVSALTSVLFVRDLITGGGDFKFTLQIIIWLWFTVLFANFAEAVAEGAAKRRPTRCARRAPRPRPSCWPARTEPSSSWCPAPA